MPRSIRSHIVPRGYLRAFARGERVAIRHTPDDRRTVAHIDKAAVVKDFYRRRRPDGSLIQDIERALDGLEGRVLPVIRGLPDAWPIGPDVKAEVAEFMAVQLLRSPAFREFDDRNLAQTFDDWRCEVLLSPDPRVDVRAELEHLREQQALLAMDSQRWMRTFDLIAKSASVFAAMHWALVEFASDIELCSSDHPIVPWPVTAVRAEPGPLRLEHGLRPVLEVRFPVGRRHALLLTWLDEPDGALLRADGDIAANINAFTRGQARRQWFHHPDADPQIHSGSAGPIGPLLLPHYDAATVEGSLRRQRMDQAVQPKLGRPTDGEITVVTLQTQDQASPRR